MVDVVKDFSYYWSMDDIGRAFLPHNSSVQAEHFENGLVRYVDFDDIGMEIGTTSRYITRELAYGTKYITISELGKNLLLLEEL